MSLFAKKRRHGSKRIEQCLKKTRSALSDLEHNINDFKNEPLNTLTREESLPKLMSSKWKRNAILCQTCCWRTTLYVKCLLCHKNLRRKASVLLSLLKNRYGYDSPLYFPHELFMSFWKGPQLTLAGQYSTFQEDSVILYETRTQIRLPGQKRIKDQKQIARHKKPQLVCDPCLM